MLPSTNPRGKLKLEAEEGLKGVIFIKLSFFFQDAIYKCQLTFPSKSQAKLNFQLNMSIKCKSRKTQLRILNSRDLCTCQNRNNIFERQKKNKTLNLARKLVYNKEIQK